jgi:NADH-quinone oxidoreductase subunit G
LRDGDAGVRLFEPAAAAQADYYGPAPAAFAARSDAQRVLPLYHIFGSEELSARATPVAARIPAAYIALSASDAQRLNIDASDRVLLTLAAATVQLPVQIDATLPAGTIGVPVGLAESPVLLGADVWANISKGVA